MYLRFKVSPWVYRGIKHLRPKHTPHTLKTLTTLIIFTAVSILPSEALAFDARITNSPLAQFRLPLESPLASFAPHTTDETLLTAINTVPSYRFTESGNAIALSTPFTTAGHWPKLKAVPERLAQEFVTIQKPVPAATPAPAAPAPAPAPAPAAGSPILVLKGEASYYSRAGCLGCSPTLTMANGQPLNDNALTMAIGADRKHLVGRKARVTSLATGKSTMVTITDTGGFYKAKYGNRVADLTIGTKQAIGMAGGVGQVQVEVF